MKKLNRVQDSLFFLVWCGIVLYIASSTSAHHDWFVAAWCIFLIGLALSALVSAQIRTRAIKRFAAASNLLFTGEDLPRGLLISRTSLALKDYSIENCMWGDLRHVSLAVFDLCYRSGKSSVSQTIVAFPRTGLQAIPEPPIDALGSYCFEAAGDWIIGWIPRRTVKVEELEDWCIELHTLARDNLAEAKGESDVSVRLFRWMT